MQVDEYRALLKKSDIHTDYKAVLVRGVPQNPMFDVQSFEAIIDDFETKDGDVFIATYVKAGTTWVQQILHCLLRKGESGGRYGESVPWLEACASSPEVIGPREAPNWTIDKMNAAPPPRYFKTHAKVRDLPRGQARVKVVYVARNPKDTVVSLYHHARNKPEFEFTGDFETFLQIFLSNLAENGSWFDHVLEWEDECRRHPETCLFLKYEDICDDTVGSICKIADFLKIPIDDKILHDTLIASSLQEMKINASIGLNHLRSGGYGGWKNVFTVQMNELFDDQYKKRMSGSELTFKFGIDAHGTPIIK